MQIKQAKQLKAKIDVWQADIAVLTFQLWVSMWLIIKFLKGKSEILCPDEELQKWFNNHWLSFNDEDKGYGNRIRSGNSKTVCTFRDEIV